MNATLVILIAVAAAVVLGGVAFASLARRSDVRGAGALSAETVKRDAEARRDERETVDVGATTAREVEAEAAAARAGTGLAPIESDTELAPWTPPDPEELGVSRRQFFNRASISLMAAGLGSFAAASFVAFLWPSGTGGFGGKVNVGRIDEVRAGIAGGDGFFYAPEARAWVTVYPVDAVQKAAEIYPSSLLPGMERGLIASWQKCQHLGCRVPQCTTSHWFECGSHGSKYKRVGEKKGGPAPRGMDHFPLEFTAASEVVIDTGTVVQGMPIGTNTTGQEAEGPHCVGASDH